MRLLTGYWTPAHNEHLCNPTQHRTRVKPILDSRIHIVNTVDKAKTGGQNIKKKEPSRGIGENMLYSEVESTVMNRA